MPIYFIQAADKTGLIKIGWAVDVNKRLKDIQRMCPIRLIVLDTHKGDARTEYIIHRIFQEYRLHGEWFEPEQKLLNFIQDEESRNKIINNKKGINKKIRQLRYNSGLTKASFCKKIGVSVGAIDRWESGVNLPSDNSIQKIEAAFNIKLDSLFVVEAQESA